MPPPADDAPARDRAYEQLLQGCAHVVAGDYAAAAESLRLGFVIHEELPEDFELLPNMSIAAFHLGEFDRSEAYMQRLLGHARNNGAAVMVLYALTRLAIIDLVAGTVVGRGRRRHRGRLPRGGDQPPRARRHPRRPADAPGRPAR